MPLWKKCSCRLLAIRSDSAPSTYLEVRRTAQCAGAVGERNDPASSNSPKTESPSHAICRTLNVSAAVDSDYAQFLVSEFDGKASSLIVRTFQAQWRE